MKSEFEFGGVQIRKKVMMARIIAEKATSLGLHTNG
jgi:hypothetical protein